MRLAEGPENTTDDNESAEGLKIGRKIFEDYDNSFYKRIYKELSWIKAYKIRI